MTPEGMLNMLEAHGVPLDKVFAWTMCYFPFVMGGDVWQPAGEEVACDRPVFHKGYFLAVLRGPDGMTAVAHFDSGAIVGDTLEQVMADIDTGDAALMRDQVEKAMRQRDGAKRLDEGELWRRLRKTLEKRATA